MIVPKSYEELAACIEGEGKIVLFFTADWCPDCQFIYPSLPEIEAAFADFRFVRVDRDDWPRSGTFSASPVLWSLKRVRKSAALWIRTEKPRRK